MTSGVLVLTASSNVPLTVELFADWMLRLPRELSPFTLHEKQPSVDMILSFD